VLSVKQSYLGKVMKKICSTTQNKKVMYIKWRWGNFYLPPPQLV